MREPVKRGTCFSNFRERYRTDRLNRQRARDKRRRPFNFMQNLCAIQRNHQRGYILTKERRENHSHQIESNDGSSKIQCFSSFLTFPRMRLRNFPPIIGN